MPANRFGLLSLAIIIATASTGLAQDASPRLSALDQLGAQNLNSIASSPRMGGPQGISVYELPASAAYLDAQKVDAQYAVRAGSSRPIPVFDLAHPSHIPGVKGSRPFVSHGPISRSPGTRRRVYRPYPIVTPTHLSQQAPQPAPVITAPPQGSTPVHQPVVAQQPVVTQPAIQASPATTTSAIDAMFPGIGGRL